VHIVDVSVKRGLGGKEKTMIREVGGRRREESLKGLRRKGQAWVAYLNTLFH